MSEVWIEGRYNYRPPFDDPVLLPEKKGMPGQVNILKLLKPFEGQRIRIRIDRLK